MKKQIAKFVINGCLMAIFTWALHQLIFQYLGSNTGGTYAIASALTIAPIMCVNFFIQRSWVFNQSGLFIRFLLTDLFIMTLITFLAPAFRELIELVAGPPWGDKAGFSAASLLCAIPSFIIRRTWVFGLALKGGQTNYS